jgi:aryl-alcohol dehydrogenase-like predicted oxidoreductase
MVTRRTFLAASVAGAAALAVAPLRGWAQAGNGTAAASAIEKRAIPSSGQQVPVIGMGTSGSFQVGTSQAERDPLREVLRRFFAGGGTLIDTAPSYGTAEEVVGDLLAELGLRERCFLATKLSETGRDANLAQFETSLRRLKTDKVELLQVHNLRDWRTSFGVVEALKKEGKVRYSGLTHYQDAGHAELVQVMRETKPDFVQINYSVISRNAEREVFPVAQELGTAVLINRAFDDGNLFAKAGDKALPAWAAEISATSWAQLFLRFSLSHPAVTAVIPATGKPDRQSDNLKAGSGPRLTDAQRDELSAMFA